MHVTRQFLAGLRMLLVLAVLVGLVYPLAMTGVGQLLLHDRANGSLVHTDGRTIGVPLAWFPRLLHATPARRERYRISVTGQGLHWEELDEDISVPGLLAGHGDMTSHRPAVA